MSGAALGPGAEFDLIRRFLARGVAGARGVAVGPGDDCAIVTGGRIAVSTDLSVEGVHFRRDWIDPHGIGYRATAASLSDLAAVAATPIGVLTSLALPPADVPEFAAAVMDGVLAAAADVGATLLGGDVASSTGPLVIDVVVLGEAERPVLRTGARPGDRVWVTGALGGAAAAVRAWAQGRTPDPEARNAFARPRPRVREARWLAERDVAHALIDLSDGLAGDASHLAAASQVAIVLAPGGVPIHPAALREADAAGALELALGGGEDYELCFTAAPGAVERIAGEFTAAFGLPLHRVGEVREGRGVLARGADGSLAPLTITGFRHFEGDAG